MENHAATSGNHTMAEENSSMRCEILNFPAGNEDLLCRLFETVFGQAVSEQKWAWKYEDGPRLGSINLAARGVDGTWVGHLGAMIFPGTYRNQSVAMAHVCDLMLAREARGGVGRDGVYPRLAAAMQRKLREIYPNAYAYGFAGVRPFRLGERLGFNRRLYECESSRIVGPGPKVLAAGLWSVTPSDWDLDRVDRFWPRLKVSTDTYMVNRTGPYLGWRYRDHPEQPYRLWMVKKIFRDAGWLVTRNFPGGELCIVDGQLIFPDAADLVCAALWHAAVRHEQQAPSSITTWLSGATRGRQRTPIVAGEFRVQLWHASNPAPRFQPGDTDVF